MTRHDFGVETAESAEAWAESVRIYYDHQRAEGVEPITLSDSLIWALPGGDTDGELAKRGLKVAIERRNIYVASYLDPLELDEAQ